MVKWFNLIFVLLKLICALDLFNVEHMVLLNLWPHLSVWWFLFTWRLCPPPELNWWDASIDDFKTFPASSSSFFFKSHTRAALWDSHHFPPSDQLYMHVVCWWFNFCFYVWLEHIKIKCAQFRDISILSPHQDLFSSLGYLWINSKWFIVNCTNIDPPGFKSPLGRPADQEINLF